VFHSRSASITRENAPLGLHRLDARAYVGRITKNQNAKIARLIPSACSAEVSYGAHLPTRYVQ
jgi:hypothetical protein